MEDLKDALGRILLWHETHNRLIVNLLQKGLSVSEVGGKTAALPFNFTEELVELYTWRNGTKVSQQHTLNDHYFLPGYYLLSLEDAIYNYQSLEDSLVELTPGLPILTSGGGDFYIAQCGEEIEVSGGVINYLRGEYEHPYTYLTVTSMMITVAECYETGAYFLTNDGLLKIDNVMEANIARKFNPGVPR